MLLNSVSFALLSLLSFPDWRGRHFFCGSLYSVGTKQAHREASVKQLIGGWKVQQKPKPHAGTSWKKKNKTKRGNLCFRSTWQHVKHKHSSRVTHIMSQCGPNSSHVGQRAWAGRLNIRGLITCSYRGISNSHRYILGRNVLLNQLALSPESRGFERQQTTWSKDKKAVSTMFTMSKAAIWLHWQ